MSFYWVLKGHEVVPGTREQWSRMFEDLELRSVAQDDVGDTHISTVFLGIDHNWGSGPPLLFETMIFGSDDLLWERYTTWEEAEKGHAAAVRSLKP